MMQSIHEQPGQGDFFHKATMGLRRRKLSIGLRMTPMIDVIFLLLTFFVMTARFQQPEASLSILMGQAQTQTVNIDKTPISIQITAADNGCLVSVAGRPATAIYADIPAEGLMKFTESIRNYIETVGQRPIELVCEDEVSWDLVVKIYDVLYAIGAEDMTFRIDS